MGWVKLKPSCPGTPTTCVVKGRLAVAKRGFANVITITTPRIYHYTDATLDPAGDIQLAQFPLSALAASAIQVDPVKLSVPGVTFNTSGATAYVQPDVIDVVQEISNMKNQEDNDVF